MQEETIIETTQVRVSATPIAMSGIIISTMMLAGASGHAFAYIPIRLAELGFETWVAAAMTPALALGGFFGCIIVGLLLRLSGHARIFMIAYAVVILSFLLVLITQNPWVWILSRAMYGFGSTAVFIIAQSWLHDVSTDDNRGRVITAFYVLYVVSLGIGAYAIGFVDVNTFIPMAICIFLATLALFPVGLTRLRQPEPPEMVKIQIRKLWKISPVGLIGMFAVGGLTMTLQGYVPIYTGTLGFSPADIGLMMLMMQMGLIFVQLPMGALSDRIDRRYVLLMVASMSAVLGVLALVTESNLNFFWLVLIFAVWSGSIETFYSVSSALANDRADPKDYVFLSSTQMVMWSLGAFIVPLITTIMLVYLPITLFMWVLVLISILFAIFVIIRIFSREAVDPQEADSFQYATAQVVNTGEYYNPEMTAEANAGVGEGLLT